MHGRFWGKPGNGVNKKIEEGLFPLYKIFLGKSTIDRVIKALKEKCLIEKG